MPYDFLQNKKYDVPFDKLHELFLKANVFGNSEFEKNYFGEWIRLLKDTEYKPPYETHYFSENRTNILFSICENFQQPLSFGYQDYFTDIFLHFNIQNALSFASKHFKKPIEVPTDYFMGESQFIGWTKPDTGKTFSKDKPVIIVPLTYGAYYKCLVIDGNHRITEAISESKQKIPAFILTEDSIMNNDITSSPFDAALYAFQNDLATLLTLQKYNNTPHEELLNQSYLRTGKVISRIRLNF